MKTLDTTARAIRIYASVLARLPWVGPAATPLAVIKLFLLASPPAQAQSVKWVERAGSGPAPREYYAMAYDSIRDVTVLFGGSSGNGGLDDTWEWNGTTWSQPPATGPSRRVAHAMAYDAARGVTVLFGGAFSNVANGETWEWDGSDWTQRTVSGPPPRYFHAMAYDANRGVTVVFGGWNGGYLGDTWEWNGSAWSQRLVSGPSPRVDHAMAYDAARGVTVLFGGGAGGSPSSETWEWNGTLWTQRLVSDLSPRTTHAMAYDSARGVTVLFGGRFLNDDHQFDYNGETWEWDGSSWSQRSVTGPLPRANHSMAYDSARGVTVLFGGSGNNGLLGDTWELRNCVGDIAGDGDGTIDLDDLATLLSDFGCASPPSPTCRGDLNNDGVVDTSDLAIMLSRFGSTCP